MTVFLQGVYVRLGIRSVLDRVDTLVGMLRAASEEGAESGLVGDSSLMKISKGLRAEPPGATSSVAMSAAAARGQQGAGSGLTIIQGPALDLRGSGSSGFKDSAIGSDLSSEKRSTPHPKKERPLGVPGKWFGKRQE